ncbi:germination protein M [Lachnospiraceae bacterium XBB1006]|nr:germination protein M [Lachnospiraceae bacterium XBB1006]
MKRKFGALVLCVILFLTGCQNPVSKKQEPDTCVYYLNTEGDKIEPVAYEFQNTSVKGRVRELLKQLRKTPGEGRQPALPSDVMLVANTLEKKQLTLYFNDSYEEMSVVREVLARAAIVRTLLQIEEIDYVSFYVADAPLKDNSGRFVGAMGRDTFVENVGQKINSITEQTYTLYYANKSGKKLVPVKRDVYAMSSVSSERTILEQLMDVEPNATYHSVIPKGTKLVSTSTIDGVCLVVFDEGFLKQNYSLREDVVIYGIVNSLCELPTVNKVQISVKGEAGIVYREKFSLDEYYERNLDLVEVKEK